ncbi:translation initiation factor IF-2-like [Mustela erminea]|uniref:translation initiation factor IF-2-like n=1 Tax=Mustela erminea TaxID=36723 RepID=UPI0013873762|nr:translation initiation factor IF-2-like [Mustela erminea]
MSTNSKTRLIALWKNFVYGRSSTSKYERRLTQTRRARGGDRELTETENRRERQAPRRDDRSSRTSPHGPPLPHTQTGEGATPEPTEDTGPQTAGETGSDRHAAVLSRGRKPPPRFTGPCQRNQGTPSDTPPRPTTAVLPAARDFAPVSAPPVPKRSCRRRPVHSAPATSEKGPAPRLGTNGLQNWPALDGVAGALGSGAPRRPLWAVRRLDSEFPSCTRTEHFACQSPSDSADGAASPLPTPLGGSPPELQGSSCTGVSERPRTGRRVPGNACSTQPRPTFLSDATTSSPEAQEVEIRADLSSGQPRPVSHPPHHSCPGRARPRASLTPPAGSRALREAAPSALGVPAAPGSRRRTARLRAPALRPRVPPLAAPAAGAASGKKPAGPGAGRGLSTRTARARQAPAQAEEPPFTASLHRPQARRRQDGSGSRPRRFVRV